MFDNMFIIIIIIITITADSFHITNEIIIIMKCSDKCSYVLMLKQKDNLNSCMTRYVIVNVTTQGCVSTLAQPEGAPVLWRKSGLRQYTAATQGLLQYSAATQELLQLNDCFNFTSCIKRRK